MRASVVVYSKVVFLFLLSVAPQSQALVITGWFEDGSGADYQYSYGVEYAKDFGDTWKTVATWQNPTHENLSSVTEQATISKSRTVSIQAGWSEMLVALLSISEEVGIDVTKSYVIPACVDLATARWKWLGDYITGGAWSKYSEDRSTFITSGNISAGYYNYSPLFSGVIVQDKCDHGVCKVSVPGTLFLLPFGLTFILRKKHPFNQI